MIFKRHHRDVETWVLEIKTSYLNRWSSYEFGHHLARSERKKETSFSKRVHLHQLTDSPSGFQLMNFHNKIFY